MSNEIKSLVTIGHLRTKTTENMLTLDTILTRCAERAQQGYGHVIIPEYINKTTYDALLQVKTVEGGSDGLEVYSHGTATIIIWNQNYC